MTPTTAVSLLRWMIGSLVLLTVVPGSLVGKEVEYEHDVRALLKERCWACHGALKQEAGLRLDTAQLMLRGGDSGPAIVAGKPADSLLIERISDSAQPMPPEGSMLSAEEVAAVTAWIQHGAPAPANETPEPDPREHWAFQKPVRPAIPVVTPPLTATNPIDAFLLAKMQEQKLVPRPTADRSILLRRLYLDLVGVPPTPEELQAFLQEESAAAYEAVVDRLLHDPRYGQRWGRHWLDIWRYSDWHGRRNVPDVWNSAPQIWRWRDWVVDSLNQDLGYDEMIRLMLAADEVAPESDDAVVATGFLVRNWYALNPNDWMRSNVEHTGKAFLGLTFNCAHCHDHKYDPISHDNYFQMRAWFEPIDLRQDRLPGLADPGPFVEYQYGVVRKIQRLGLIRVFDRHPEATTWFYEGGDERNRVTEKGGINPGVPSVLSESQPVIEPISLPPRAFYPGLRPEIQETIRAELQAQLAKAETDREAAEQELQKSADSDRQELAAARNQLEAVIAAVRDSSPEIPMAIAGQQSLVLDASSGRRALQNRLDQLSELPDGAVIEFQLRILRDAHFNFQLVKDLDKGLTAAYIGFEQGRIESYQPGSTNVFTVGNYPATDRPASFYVLLKLDRANDVGVLTIRSEVQGGLLVDQARIALNGWNPVQHPEMGIVFDARPGSVAAVDAWRLSAPVIDATAVSSPVAPLLAFDFEAPVYVEGKDIVGIEDWQASQLSVAPALSEVRHILASPPEIQQAEQALHRVQHAQEARQQRVTAAVTKIEATKRQLEALDARIAADQAKYGEAPEADFSVLSQTASRLERDAAVQVATADLLAQEVVLKSAHAKPDDDANRAKEIDAATKQVAVLQGQRDAAREALADEARAETYTPLTPIYPATSTGRRSALAAWIASLDNPLTARVAVNHIWLRHFHAPLVSTVYDFGRNGVPPTHPELLDWLAVEFMGSGRSMRHMHRLIVTSQAYQRASSVGEDAAENQQRDPENRYLWRMNPGRMEAEVVRDSLLACAGKLDDSLGGQELENSQIFTTRRRSLYYSTYPEADGMSPLGALFNAANPLDCYRRLETVVPQQALALTNSDLVHEMSAAVVQQWPPQRNAAGDCLWDAIITESFGRILSRAPTAAEHSLCREGIQRQLQQLSAENVSEPELRTCESLIRVLFNHNDFLTIR